AGAAARREGWGRCGFADELLREACPPLYESEEDRRHFLNWHRLSASPAAASALLRAWSETDLRDVLPSVRVPTLVMYLPAGEREVLDVAARIPSARALRIPGDGWSGLEVRPGAVEEVHRLVAGADLPNVPH